MRTLLIGAVAAVIALGAGAFVADASNHPSFGSSPEQAMDRGGPGAGFGGGAPGDGPPPSRRDE